jgi:hypothetical protein
MEHRNYHRIALKNFSVDAADGRGFFQGAVSDISRFGVCLMGLPPRINSAAKRMTIIVSGQGKNFRMNVRPRWTMTDGVSKTVGAEILSPPWGWTEFVMSHEPRVDQDAWASVTM